MLIEDSMTVTGKEDADELNDGERSMLSESTDEDPADAEDDEPMYLQVAGLQLRNVCGG